MQITKFFFHLINLVFLIFYLYPGSILGFLLYGNFKKQPQISPDFYFSSYQKRALNTLKLILNTIRVKEERVVKAWELNERHYGELTGLNKDEMKKKIWRRQNF